MKLALYTTKESYSEALLRQADAIEKHGLAQARENLQKALSGIGRSEFLRINNISEQNADAEWEHHIAWLQDSVRYLERKVKKYRRDAFKVMEEAKSI